MLIRLGGAAVVQRLEFLSNSRGRRNARALGCDLGTTGRDLGTRHLVRRASFRILRKYNSFSSAQSAIFET